MFEGVPAVALESMVAGKPLIVSGIPGLRDLVVDGGNGLTVPPKGVKKLSSAMERLLSSPNLLNSVDSINKEILVRFDWDTVAFNILRIYEENN